MPPGKESTFATIREAVDAVNAARSSVNAARTSMKRGITGAAVYSDANMSILLPWLRGGFGRTSRQRGIDNVTVSTTTDADQRHF